MHIEVGILLGVRQDQRVLFAFRYEIAEPTIYLLGLLYFPMLFMVYLPVHVLPYISSYVRVVLLCWFVLALPMYFLYQL